MFIRRYALRSLTFVRYVCFVPLHKKKHVSSDRFLFIRFSHTYNDPQVKKKNRYIYQTANDLHSANTKKSLE